MPVVWRPGIVVSSDGGAAEAEQARSTHGRLRSPCTTRRRAGGRPWTCRERDDSRATSACPSRRVAGVDHEVRVIHDLLIVDLRVIRYDHYGVRSAELGRR